MRKYFPPAAVEKLVTLFTLYGEIVPVESNITMCRDPKDNFLLKVSSPCSGVIGKTPPIPQSRGDLQRRILPEGKLEVK